MTTDSFESLRPVLLVWGFQGARSIVKARHILQFRNGSTMEGPAPKPCSYIGEVPFKPNVQPVNP
eukprot:2806477-Amphidinium_carterae.1